MMKKMILVACSVALVMSCDDKGSGRNAAQQAERDSLVQIINQRDTELNDIMSTFNDVQEGLRQINEAEGRINLEKENPEASREDLTESIAFIKRTMQLNKERIAHLQQQLKGSSFNNTKLQETIEQLNNEIEQKNGQIEQLQKELEAKNIRIAEQDQTIADLNSNVSDLTADNKQKEETVSAQDKQLHTAWYVFGTKKELKEQRILQSGDVLKNESFNKDYFTKIDIRVDKTIKLYSKSAKLLTTHPAGSYSLDKDTKGQYTLRITKPDLFWSVSRYLVIVVK